MLHPLLQPDVYSCAQHDAPATPCDAAIIRALVLAADESRTVMRRVLDLRPAEIAAAAAAVYFPT